MTATTPTYAHACQSICLAGRPLVVHHQNFRLPASKARYRIFLTPETQHMKKATTSKDGPFFFQMEVLASLRAKPQLGWAPSPALLMECFMSCLAQLSQPKHISRMQAPDSIPTTPLNTRVSLRRFPSSCPMAQWLVNHKRVSSTIPGTRPALAWALSNHARMSPWSSSSKRLLLQVQLRLRFTFQHIYSHAQNPGTNVQTMLPCSVHLV